MDGKISELMRYLPTVLAVVCIVCVEDKIKAQFCVMYSVDKGEYVVPVIEVNVVYIGPRAFWMVEISAALSGSPEPQAE